MSSLTALASSHSSSAALSDSSKATEEAVRLLKQGLIKPFQLVENSRPYLKGLVDQPSSKIPSALKVDFLNELYAKMAKQQSRQANKRQFHQKCPRRRDKIVAILDLYDDEMKRRLLCPTSSEEEEEEEKEEEEEEEESSSDEEEPSPQKKQPSKPSTSFASHQGATTSKKLKQASAQSAPAKKAVPRKKHGTRAASTASATQQPVREKATTTDTLPPSNENSCSKSSNETSISKKVSFATGVNEQSESNNNTARKTVPRTRTPLSTTALAKNVNAMEFLESRGVVDVEGLLERPSKVLHEDYHCWHPAHHRSSIKYVESWKTQAQLPLEQLPTDESSSSRSKGEKATSMLLPPGSGQSESRPKVAVSSTVSTSTKPSSTMQPRVKKRFIPSPPPTPSPETVQKKKARPAPSSAAPRRNITPSPVVNLDKVSVKDTMKLLKANKLDSFKFVEENISRIQVIADRDPSENASMKMNEMLTTLALQLKDDPHYGEEKLHEAFPNVSAKAAAILDMFARRKQQEQAQAHAPPPPKPPSGTQQALAVFDGGHENTSLQANSYCERGQMEKLPMIDHEFLDLGDIGRITSAYRAVVNQVPHCEPSPNDFRAYSKGPKGAHNIERQFDFMVTIDKHLEVEVSKGALSRALANGQALHGCSLNEEDFPNSKSIPTALTRVTLVRSCLMDVVGSQEQPTDGISFSASGFSAEMSPDLTIEERKLKMPSVSVFELFLMLPTDILPLLSEQQFHRLLDLVKLNITGLLEVGFKTIAMSMESDDSAKRKAIFENLSSMLGEWSSCNFEDKFHRVSILGTNLLFLARFSAYCWAHLHLTRSWDQSQTSRCIPKADAAKAMDLLKELAHHFAVN